MAARVAGVSGAHLAVLLPKGGARTVLRPQHVRRVRNDGSDSDFHPQAARCGRGASAVRSKRGCGPAQRAHLRTTTKWLRGGSS